MSNPLLLLLAYFLQRHGARLRFHSEFRDRTGHGGGLTNHSWEDPESSSG
jgi:hypothetical protein